ncbi:hypothetical protein C8J57DRAFT_352929 [Mycena rebaudengoi]|nr:hypothetical protein C8J57DRAFT_352929 [Mycena rebaudengoi]
MKLLLLVLADSLLSSRFEFLGVLLEAASASPASPLQLSFASPRLSLPCPNTTAFTDGSPLPLSPRLGTSWRNPHTTSEYPPA